MCVSGCVCLLFCSSDLDLDLMYLDTCPDLDILKMYLHTEDKFVGEVVRRLETEQDRHTDSQTHTQTHTTELITTHAHSWVVMKRI